MIRQRRLVLNYFSNGSKKELTWIFIHSSSTVQFLFKEILFPRVLKGLACGICIKQYWERCTAENYRLIIIFSVVSKIFEKPVNCRFVDNLDKCELFSDFQYGFRSSWSTADLLTVVSDRIARFFNRSGTTQAVALDIFKAFDRVQYASLLQKPNFWKKNDLQTCKSGSCKNLFVQCVRYWCNLLRWIFFILCDNWKTLIFLKN